MEITNELHVQRHDPLDVWIRGAFGYADRSPYLRRRTGFRQNASQEGSRAESVPGKVVAVLRHCIHTVRLTRKRKWRRY